MQRQIKSSFHFYDFSQKTRVFLINQNETSNWKTLYIEYTTIKFIDVQTIHCLLLYEGEYTDTFVSVIRKPR